jgi:DNA polymerase-3 subunit epsilon
MREVVVDTETTGLDPVSGHRLVEIACVEVVNLVPTRAHFHSFINPERDVPREAFNIHGLSTEFLLEKPLFATVAAGFLDFIADSRLVIHNAEFDLKFINFELQRLSFPPVDSRRVLDTLAIARKKHPNSANSLDALCARYRVNNAKRTKHGALLDAELLADVYVELMGGRQTHMSLAVASAGKKIVSDVFRTVIPRRLRELAPRLEVGDTDQHRLLIDRLQGRALWRDYDPVHSGEGE